jgi:hypothetical protein
MCWREEREMEIVDEPGDAAGFLGERLGQVTRTVNGLSDRPESRSGR